MNNNFSENLKKIRKDNNLSQEQLAEELGVSRQAISKWESSVAYPEMDKIIALCNKFNLNIDDLLHKDIREVKGEEVTKKKLNNFFDDFLRFITDTINMFSNMTFKTKVKCLFEQFVIAFILLIIFLVVGLIINDFLLGIFEIVPRISYVLRTAINFIYFIFSLTVSIIILFHIFKTRYLDYYKKIKEEVINDDNDKDEKEDNRQYKKNKILFRENEKKFVIRDPKDSEYRFINGFFKVIVGIFKFFILCFSILLFFILIVLFVLFILSFLISKTGLVFIGLLISIISSSVIDIVFILLLLNFVFNRKNEKKRVIWSVIISLVALGIGIGLVLVGLLSFEYIENDKDILKTEYLEFEMEDDFIFGTVYPGVEYIESDNENIKIEYSINSYCNISHTITSNNIIHIWGSCDDSIGAIKTFIDKFNNRKIIPIYNGIHNVKVYTTRENIEILKKNYDDYNDFEIRNQSIINNYENKINELESKINDYVQKEYEYNDEINNLKYKLTMYENE